MLPRPNRLTKKKEFEKTYQQGKAVGGEFLLVKISPNQENKTRVGIVVSKKVAKKATERNKIKRRIREIVRSEVLEGKTVGDIVIIAKRSSEKSSYQELKADWENILLKLS